MSENRYIEEDRISISSLIQNFKAWLKAMINVWLKIFTGAVIIGGLFFAYQSLKKINYTAETTFTLEGEASGGGLGQLSSLVGLTGVNLGGALGGESDLFKLDNMQALYSSYRMMREALLTSKDSELGTERLITWYGRNHNQEKKWSKKGISFEIPMSQFVVQHDSVLKEVTRDILDLNLMVAKPDRKLNILSVAYTSDDELFAKAFNEVLVSRVNQFYAFTKTKKTGENLRILSFQVDSVKKVLDQSLLDLANFEENNINVNTFRSTAMVPRQKIMIDLQASSAIYEELVKNLEITKLSHRNSTPLIQTIDEPILPLADDHMKWYKALVIGLFVGGVLMVLFFTLSRIYVSAMAEDK